MAFGLSATIPRAKYDDATTVFDTALFEATAYYATGSDGTSGADSYSDIWTAYQSFTEGVTGADASDDIWTAYRSFTEGVSGADLYDDIWTAYQSFTEGVTGSEGEGFGLAFTVGKVLVEGVKITEAGTLSVVRQIGAWVSSGYVSVRNLFKNFTKSARSGGDWTKKSDQTDNWTKTT